MSSPLTFKGRIDSEYSSAKQGVASSSHDESVGCIGCLQRRLNIIPIVTTVWVISSMLLSYTISTAQGHTEPDFPYISHTAREEPERCIFSTCMTISAFLFGLNAAVKYLHVKQLFITLNMSYTWQRTNLAALNIGLISAFGLIILGNFPTDVQKVIHYIGAFFAFAGGLTYYWIQTRFSWYLKSRGHLTRVYIAFVQLILCAVLTGFLFIFGISKTIYKVQEANNTGTKYDSLRAVYLISTISEWIVAVLNATFILTFIPDFRNIKLISPSIAFLENIETEKVIHQPKTTEENC